MDLVRAVHELDPRKDRRDGRVLAKAPERGGKEARDIGVVRIEEADEFALGATHARVPGRRRSRIQGVPEHGDVRVALAECAAERNRAVGRAIIDQYDLDADVALSQYGVYCGRQRPGGVEI